MIIKFATASAACLGLAAFSAPPVAQGDDMLAAQVVVEGPDNRVYEFHQNLKGILSAFLVDGNLGNAGVDCNVTIGEDIKSCDALSGGGEGRRPRATATYYIFRDHERLTAFVLSWKKLQDRENTNVSLKLDMGVPPPDCGAALQPCVGATQCPNTVPRRCDKVKGAPCTSCGMPP